jgi:hypothetical protein
VTCPVATIAVWDLRNLPSKAAQNQIWTEIVALACELLVWTAMLALNGTARRWEPRGAPLVAREFETGTYRLAWTQTTRTRWIAIKLAAIGLAGVVLTAILSLIVTWWSGPLDAVTMTPYSSFDQRDLVPLGYAAFAFVIGVAAGSRE